jgi:hypothetical protein
MKAFVIGLLITLALGIGVFFLGWVPLTLENQTAGVVYTKLGGYKEQVLLAGNDQFHWFWENIIPDMLTVYQFPLGEESQRYILQGQLPSGEVYGDYLGSATTFQYNVEFNLSFRLDPQLLPSLADEEGWLPENLPEQYEKIFQDFVNAVALDLRETYVSEDVAVDVMVGGPEYSQRIKGLFEERYPYFQGVEVNLVRFQIPDVDLYLSTREVFLAQLASQRSYEEFWQEQEWSLESRETIRLSWLEKYGQLFEEYPQLIEFFSIGLEDEKISSLLPDFSSFQEAVAP